MYCKITSATLHGIDAIPTQIETDISDGLPVFDMVGFLGKEVTEARERVRTALKNCNYAIPARRITVNISPAGIKKQGTVYDLGIALSLLICLKTIPAEFASHTCVIGELGLNGQVKGISGVLSMVIMAKQQGFDTCIIPADNVSEASLVKGIRLIGVKSLKQTIDLISNNYKNYTASVNITNSIPSKIQTNKLDFSDINGQYLLKRVAEISATGLHNLLISGPPGSGKTMTAMRIPTILPPLSESERLELTKIHSIAGVLPPEGIISERPFIAPHHTATTFAMAGGGNTVRPGAITLAHKSVLFLDELTEFRSEVLDILRQPLQDKKITLFRLKGQLTFPADFLLICAMNPCKCGYYPDLSRCSCTKSSLDRYLSKISGPLLDRIDLNVSAPTISYDDLTTVTKNETSHTIRQRVIENRLIQQNRFKDLDISVNSQMTPKEIAKFCPLGHSEELLIKEAFSTLNLSARHYHKLLKTARTIADMDHSDKIKEPHICEALAYRNVLPSISS